MRSKRQSIKWLQSGQRDKFMNFILPVYAMNGELYIVELGNNTQLHHITVEIIIHLYIVIWKQYTAHEIPVYVSLHFLPRHFALLKRGNLSQSSENIKWALF